MKNWHSLTMFESATLRLTAWYVVLLMALSLLFSLTLFYMASREFDRALGPRGAGEMRLFLESDAADSVREKRINDSNTRIVGGLALFNLAVLIGGGAASYFLARRTLQPIELAHSAQVQFASDAAHELRTPLTVMQTEMEVGLRDKNATEHDYRVVLKSSLEEVGRLRELTDRLLRLASQQELPLVEIDVEAVATDALSHVVTLAQQKNISVENTVTASKATAHAESVTSVLGILLENAIKYSPAGSSVTLSGHVTERWVELSVSDQGPGIAKEEQARIFDRFYRVDTSRSNENVPGHGLGLSLAKRLVDEMHGELSVTSTPGNGAVFTVRLPKLVY